MIQKADITLEDLRKANKVSLFNAMIEFGEREIARDCLTSLGSLFL